MKENNKEINIDFAEFFKIFYFNRKKIIKNSVISLLIGVLFSLTIKNSYTSSSTFVPQLASENSSSSSSLSGLASLAGINLDGLVGGEGNTTIPPTLYPEILKSTNFQLELLDNKINSISENDNLRQYLKTKNNLIQQLSDFILNIPYKIFSIFNKSYALESKVDDNNIYNITQEDDKLFKMISSKLVLTLNDKEGFISLSFSDENKYVAAEVAKISQEILQRKIIEFKIKSSRELLEFSKKQYNLKKIEFENLQDELAKFKDENLNITSSLYLNKLDRLESELNISETVVQQLATQVEQAKLQVNKDTPVFTVINAVTIPHKKSKPNRTVLVLTFFTFGFAISYLYYFLRKDISNFAKKLKN